MLRSVVIAITLSFAFAVPAYAQTLVQGEKLGKFLEINTKELGQASTNLLSMISGMNDLEEVAAKRIHDNVARMEQHQFMQLYVVVSIYARMVDRQDQATVKKFVGILSRGAVTSADGVIDRINRDVVKLSSPAAIAEAQKARDLVQKMRDEIQRVVPGG